jgi:hypothetical protein
LEDVLYELSLIGVYVAPDAVAAPAKRVKLSPPEAEESAAAGDASTDTGGGTAIAGDAVEPANVVTVNAAEFATMRETMSIYDKKREEVIKQTRDLQKLSKQAIFALQRGDFKKADAQLTETVTKVRCWLCTGAPSFHLAGPPPPPPLPGRLLALEVPLFFPITSPS